MAHRRESGTKECKSRMLLRNCSFWHAFLLFCQWAPPSSGGARHRALMAGKSLRRRVEDAVAEAIADHDPNQRLPGRDYEDVLYDVADKVFSTITEENRDALDDVVRLQGTWDSARPALAAGYPDLTHEDYSTFSSTPMRLARERWGLQRVLRFALGR